MGAQWKAKHKDIAANAKGRLFGKLAKDIMIAARNGADPAFAQAARDLGTRIGMQGGQLVYGGGRAGLMGVVADAALAAGGTVVGVINQRLHDRGHLHAGLTRHEIAPDMRARKARMGQLADAFIALPGGLGTLEELLEAATLALQTEAGCPVTAICIMCWATRNTLFSKSAL